MSIADSYDDRRDAARRSERQVLQRLNATGWTASPFGQALLSRECCRVLARYLDLAGRPTLIRWFADIITFRDDPNGPDLALIDVKACSGPNYAIETLALITAETFVDHIHIPMFFVFVDRVLVNGVFVDDWKVLTPLDVRLRGAPGKNQGNGSGTAFLLVEKCYGRPFDAIFPPAPQNLIAELRRAPNGGGK